MMILAVDTALGACSAALLARFLAAHGRQARIYIPDRMTEGYGPNREAIEALVKEGARLIVTVDCGTTGVEPLSTAKALGADVVVMLRLQNERMRGALLPSAQEFFKHYGLTADKLALAKPDAIVMHPGPMNRGVEIDSAVADGKHSVILPQVTFGIAVRMAVMSMLAGT